MKTSTETQIHVYIEGWGRSGCTCERLRDQLRQTVHTGDDDCIDLAQCNAGKGGRRQIVSLSTSQKSVWGGGGGGVERNEGFSEHYSVNRSGREGESKG